MEPNPDNKMTRRGEGARDIGGILNTNGTFYIDKGWFRSLKYAISGSYMDRHSYYEQIYNDAMGVYSLAEQDGLIATNRPGNNIYDTEGRPITNWTGNKDTFVTMLPDSYFGRYDIYGKEVNVFSKVSAQFAGKIGKTSHQILVGADFKTDGNLGDGQVFDPMTPPHNSIVAVSNRPRKYKDIPFVAAALGVFAEENRVEFCPGTKLYLQAGVRFDQIFDFKHAFSPRINLAVNILKDQALTLREGGGILSKAPTVGYLYPDRAYFDFVNFNSMTDQTVPKTNGWPWLPPEPSIQKTGPAPKSPRITKAKSESTASSEACSFSVTGYYEKMNNGYMLSSSYDTWQWMQYDIYRSSGLPSQADFRPLTLANSYGYLASYLAPSNNITDISKGVELSHGLRPYKFDSTSFTLNGAYMSNLFYENGPTFYNRDSGLTDQFHVGIYEGESGKLHRNGW